MKRAAVLIALMLWPAAATGQKATTQKSTLVRALEDEMARSMKLELPNMARPYFISYTVLDSESESLLAEYGGIVSHSAWRSRSLGLEVRVGDPKSGEASAEAGFSASLVLDDEYEVLRRQIWLATDSAYKRAASELEQKRAAEARNEKKKDERRDFSVEEPARTIVEGQGPSPELAAKKQLVRKMSGLLSDYPDIQEGVVELQAVRQDQTFVNSEGTQAQQPSSLVRLVFRCRTQADDGMNLVHYRTWVVAGLDELPGDDELIAGAKKVADELVQMRSAEVLEDYTGPILFEGEAAGQILGELLAPNLSGTPPPNDPRFQSFSGDDTLFAKKMNKKVLPRSFSVYDDPKLETYSKTKLIGGYQVDDEGVPAQKVSLIRKGMLEGFLMSRTPREDFPKSNGHGRSGYGGGARASISNLVVTATGGRSTRSLESKLISQARAEGEKFGIVVSLLDDYAVTSGYREPGETMRPGGEGGLSLTPVLVYKVSRAGKRELLRGVEIEGLRVRSLKEIIGTSIKSAAHNMLSGSLAASIIAPDLLFEEADVKERTGNNPKLPILKSPLVK